MLLKLISGLIKCSGPKRKKDMKVEGGLIEKKKGSGKLKEGKKG